MTTRIFNNSDLFPTHISTIEEMCYGIDLRNKTVLEPSAGLGDIVDYCSKNGAKVLACEIIPELRDILKSKECKIIGEDFLQINSDDVSHIDYIIMNPPFSADEKHILHAFEIAPNGCEIISLCNWETYNNHIYSKIRMQLWRLVQNYGNAKNLGNIFSDAERKTDAEIGLIKIKKPGSKKENEFEGFFLTEEEEEQYDGLQQYNFVRDVVNRYVGAVKIFDEQIDCAIKMNTLTKEFSRTSIALSFTQKDAEIKRDDYKKELQKSAWNWVINKFNLYKYSTQGLKEDINKFVETQTQIPFTMRNIYKMIEIIIGTVGNRMDKALLEVFDKLTERYHDNRWGVEGWKTNSHYLINQKFILPYVAPFDNRYGWMEFSDRTCEVLNDMTKALCFVSGDNYETKIGTGKFDTFNKEITVDKYIRFQWQKKEEIEYGQWFDWGFFEVKLFKKGTGHFKFKNRDVWALFNQNIARIKGFPLPEAVKTK